MATMKVIKTVLEIKHGSVTTTLKGVEADQALNQLLNYDGVGNIYIRYTDPQTNELTGFMFCCDDSWRRKANEVTTVNTRDCGFDCADELAFADPVSKINHATGQPIETPQPDDEDEDENAPDA